jgi:hypothetical protein
VAHLESVERDRVVTLGEHPTKTSTADIAGAAGDENVHRKSSGKKCQSAE